MRTECESQCPFCNIPIRYMIYQPTWLGIELGIKSDHPPSSMYTEYKHLNDLLTVNTLLGEQNEHLKGMIKSLHISLQQCKLNSVR